MSFELSSAVRVLERTPRALQALLAGLDPEWTDATEGPDTWSPRMIVAHLIESERENWIPRARMVLEHGASRPFPAFERTPPDGDATIESLLAELVRLRGENLATLVSWRLGDAELDRGGTHPEFGPVTLRQLLATWVAHDLAHLAQVSRVMAKRYRDAVGPWRAYLPILDR